MKIRFTCLSLCIVAVLSGCRSLHDTAPEVNVPGTEAWVTPMTSEEKLAAEELAVWWTQFGDETLTRLVQDSIDNNYNLQIAAARVEEAFALRGVAAGERVPQVNGSAGIFETRRSELEGGSGDKDSFTAYSVGFDASWELDLWGRIQNSVDAADAGARSSVEDARGVRALIASQVVSGYVTLRELQLRQKLAEGNILLQKDTLKLTKGRFDAGLVPQLDVNQAQLNLSRTEAVLPQLRQLEIQTLRQLEVLCGMTPGGLTELSEGDPEVPLPEAARLRDLPANVLRRRPDVRSAEQQFLAAAARVGVAKADLYPRISLSGSFAWQAGEAGDLFDGSSVSSSFGPSIFLPIFQGGRLRSQVDAAEARALQAELNYKQRVLESLSEVETALNAYQEELIRQEKLDQAVEAAEVTVRQVRSLYENGLVTFLNVLDAERSLAAQEDEAAASLGQSSRNLAAVYRAFGGGWDAPAFEDPVSENFLMTFPEITLASHVAEMRVMEKNDGQLTLKTEEYQSYFRLDEKSRGMVGNLVIFTEGYDPDTDKTLQGMLPGERLLLSWDEMLRKEPEEKFHIRLNEVERLSPPSP